MKNTKTQKTPELPHGFVEVRPDLSVKNKHDKIFINEILKTLTPEGKKLRDSGKGWHWVFAGDMTRNEALEKLKLLGNNWKLPTPTDSTVGALNGIKFQGDNLVDNRASGFDIRKDLPQVSFRSRGAIVGLFGFGMTCDSKDKSKHGAYFVKKS